MKIIEIKYFVNATNQTWVRTDELAILKQASFFCDQTKSFFLKANQSSLTENILNRLFLYKRKGMCGDLLEKHGLMTKSAW